MFDDQQPNVPNNLPGGDANPNEIPSLQKRATEEGTALDSAPSGGSPVNPAGQVEDIFANTEKTPSSGGKAGFKVKTASETQSQTQNHAFSPAPPSGLSGQSQVSVPPVPQPPTRSKNISPNDLEFEDHSGSSKKKYFIIGLIGLLVIGGGAAAYFFFFAGGISLPFATTSPELEETNTNAPVNPQSPPPVAPTTQPVTPSGGSSGEDVPVPAVPAAVPLDTDSDGLLDSEERAIGTSISNQDTDNDGLFDREEVKVYITDPLDPDTDGDGYLDGEEVDGGFDPKGSGRLLPDLPE